MPDQRTLETSVIEARMLEISGTHREAFLDTNPKRSSFVDYETFDEIWQKNNSRGQLSQSVISSSTSRDTYFEEFGTKESHPASKDESKTDLAALGFLGVSGIAKTGVKWTLEFIGVMDALRCVDCVRKGDWFGAALNGAFAIWSIAGLISGGAACFAKFGLKEGAQQATKEGTKALVKLGTQALEKVAEQEGKNILTKIAVEKVGEQLVKEVGVETALKVGLKEGAEKLAVASVSKIDKILSFCPGFIRNIFAERIVAHVVENKVEKFAVELVKEPTKHVVSEMLERVSKLGVSELATNYGLIEKEAAALKWLLADTGKDWISKRILHQGIVKEITQPLKSAITETFMVKFSDEAAEMIGRYGLSEVKILGAASRGLGEGLEKGISRGVKEGIDEAFKDRKRRHGSDSSNFNGEESVRRTSGKLSQAEISAPGAVTLGRVELDLSRRRARAVGRRVYHAKSVAALSPEEAGPSGLECEDISGES